MSPSPMGEGLCPSPKIFLIFELKNASFDAFWVGAIFAAELNRNWLGH